MSIATLKKGIVILAILLLAGSVFAVQSSHAAGTQATAAKAKPIVMNIIVDSEAEAEVDVMIEKISKKKAVPQIRTVVLKPGINYVTCRTLDKGNYRVTVSSYGDAAVQEITAIQGRYSLFYMIAPPKDEDTQGKSKINYLDFDKTGKTQAPTKKAAQ